MNKFLKLITKLNPIEFFGVAKILGVRIEEDSDIYAIIEQMALKFENASPKFKKDFIKVLKETVKCNLQSQK